MGAAAVEFHVFNGRAADRARRPFPPIDAEVFLVLPFFPVAANEVPYRRPAVFEAFVEDVRNASWSFAASFLVTLWARRRGRIPARNRASST